MALAVGGPAGRSQFRPAAVEQKKKEQESNRIFRRLLLIFDLLDRGKCGDFGDVSTVSCS